MTNPPIFGYNSQYHKLHGTTDEDLFELQNQILKIIKNGSSDIAKEVQTNLTDREIESILIHCYHKNMIDRERIGSIESDGNKIPLRRYFTKNS